MAAIAGAFFLLHARFVVKCRSGYARQRTHLAFRQAPTLAYSIYRSLTGSLTTFSH